MHNPLLLAVSDNAASGALQAFSGLIGGLFLILLIVIGFVVYWAPSVVAFRNKHPHFVGILVVNILFGWTLIGWIAAFIWAFIKPAPTQIIIQQAPPAANPPNTV